MINESKIGFVPARDVNFPHSSLSQEPEQFLYQATIFAVVEGENDIAFLRTISRILHTSDQRLPDLGSLELDRRLIFIPAGGGDLMRWAFRLSACDHPEFHLYDRENGADRDARQGAVDLINTRPGCRAYLTNKRSLENYLHPQAIADARGIDVEFGDDDCVPELCAERLFRNQFPHVEYESLSRRCRLRMRSAAKKWLNTEAASFMTPARIIERDSGGDLATWLTAIGALMRGLW